MWVTLGGKDPRLGGRRHMFVCLSRRAGVVWAREGDILIAFRVGVTFPFPGEPVSSLTG